MNSDMTDIGALVSILARPEGRALRHTNPVDGKPRLFQSSPVPKDGRYRSSRSNRHAPTCFNPRPSRRTGATILALFQADARCCFNPRPSRRTGATLSTPGYSGAIGVSILARPEGRALQRFAIEYNWERLFQSSPVPKDGRYEHRRSARLRCDRFNPRPSRRTGATGVTVDWYGLPFVSILARPEGRALRCYLAD